MQLSCTLEAHPAPALIGRRQFFAMNTDIRLLALDWQKAELLARCEEVFHAIEERFSRFRPSSELSLLNAAAGGEVVVSPEMFALLSLCVAYHRLSRGLFDPAVLHSLEAAGYDRSFELVPRQVADVPRPTAVPMKRSLGELVMDRERPAVRAPPDMRLDLGGIGKGYAVDRAAEILAPAGDFLIDAGGDIYASGDGPDGPGWLVSIGNPLHEGEELALIQLRDRALATSTTARRAWQRGGRWLHHLIDPRTGQPAETDIVSASIVALTAVAADVFAKVALVLGFEEGSAFLRARGSPGLFVFPDGTWQATSDWPGG